MFQKVIQIIWFLSLGLPSCLSAQMLQQALTLKGAVLDAKTKEPLSFAAIQLTRADSAWFGVAADHNGIYSIRLAAGTYKVAVSYIGYDTKIETIDVNNSQTLDFHLTSSSVALDEVVVTASEGRGKTSVSRIDRTAMEHLQPTSFADLLELLPGGKSSDPNMGSANVINLREAGGVSDVDMASQGVAFVVDGMPLDTDANLQYVPGTSQGSGKESVSKGVDMRTLTTDNIESVEIVRGIPSVEYGNLTSGLVNIRRKRQASPLTARFKADQVGKLFSAGKGWSIGGNHLLNTDISFLDSKVDPRDSRENYKRVTFSTRWNSNAQTSLGHHDWHVNADYTGSFDNVKRDKDITIKEDSYKSTYDKLALASGWTLKRPSTAFVRELAASASVSQEFNKIEEHKSVSIDRPMAAPNTLEAGEADGVFLPYTYTADMLVDGKPLYAHARLAGKFGFSLGRTEHVVKAGTEWNLSKNWGRGRVYDMSRPLNTASTTRPRSYKDIPARQLLSAYVEEEMKASLGRHRLTLTAGVRTSSLLGLSSRYALKGKVYADPRLNLQWSLPGLGKEDDWMLNLYAGLGWLSMMPSAAQLYPDEMYVDVVQLNYYSTNPDLRRINLHTYKWDNANYDLRAARNMKWEVRATLSHQGHNLSVTYFQERMDNGFTDQSYYRLFPYKKYDASSVDASTLTAPPALESMAYTQDTLIDTYSTTGNGLRVRKQGVEFTYSSSRIRPLATRFTVTGAWIKTIYSDHAMRYKSSSVLLNDKQLEYVGLYDWESGTERQQMSTNFTSDTYLQRIGMSFSLTAQCTWFTSNRPLWNSGRPVAYVDKAGQTYLFTDSDAEDARLQHLVQKYSDGYFSYTTVPFSMDVNLKATKDVGKHLKVSLFVNRLLALYPSYYRGTTLIRRSSSPYFGMEANLRL